MLKANNDVKIFLKPRGNGKIGHFFAKVERSTNFVLLFFQHGTCSSLHPTASLASLDQI